MEKRRSYTEEFKKDAVELSLNSDKTIKEIEDKLKKTKLEHDILKKAVAIFSKKPK